MAPCRAKKRKGAPEPGETARNPETPPRKSKRVQKKAKLEPTPADSGEEQAEAPEGRKRKQISGQKQRTQTQDSNQLRCSPRRHAGATSEKSIRPRKRQGAATRESDTANSYVEGMRKKHAQDMERLVALTDGQKKEVDNIARTMTEKTASFTAQKPTIDRPSSSKEQRDAPSTSTDPGAGCLKNTENGILKLCDKALRLYNQLDEKTKIAKIDTTRAFAGPKDDTEMLEMIQAAQRTGFTIVQGAVFPGGPQKHRLPHPNNASEKLIRSWFKNSTADLSTSAKGIWGLQKNIETALEGIEEDSADSMTVDKQIS